MALSSRNLTKFLFDKINGHRILDFIDDHYSPLSVPPELSQSNLNGQIIRVVGVDNAIYNFDTRMSYDNQGVPVFEPSFAVDILDALKLVLNFTMVPKVTTSWGYFNEATSSWDGMILMLLQGEADLAISSTVDAPLRRRVVDFNLPTTSSRLAVYFKRPRQVAETLALLQPFNTDIWLAVLILIIVFGLSLKILHFAVKHLQRKADESSGVSEQESPEWTVADCFIWSQAAVCCRGIHGIPEVHCSRFVIFVGYAAGIILSAFYNGRLVSFLSVARDEISTFDQLLASPFELGLTGGYRFVEEYLKNSTLAYHHRIYYKSNPRSNYEDIVQAKGEILCGSFGYITPDLSAHAHLVNNFSTDELCSGPIRNLYVPFVPPDRQGTMVPKGSPIKRIIDYQILRFQQSGLVHRGKNMYIPQYSKEHCTANERFQAVHLESLTVAFGFFGAGAIVGLLVCLLEKTICFYLRILNLYKVDELI